MQRGHLVQLDGDPIPVCRPAWSCDDYLPVLIFILPGAPCRMAAGHCQWHDIVLNFGPRAMVGRAPSL